MKNSFKLRKLFIFLLFASLAVIVYCAFNRESCGYFFHAGIFVFGASLTYLLVFFAQQETMKRPQGCRRPSRPGTIAGRAGGVAGTTCEAPSSENRSGSTRNGRGPAKGGQAVRPVSPQWRAPSGFHGVG